jgi:ABC-2 type transport system permease protein
MDQAEWVAFKTLFKKEVMRFVKVIVQTVFSPLVNAALYLLVFGVSFSSVLRMHEKFSYLAFLVPGLVALSALNNALQNSASSIMISKFHGDLQDMKIIPLSAFWMTLAYALACIVRGLFVGVLVLVLGEIFSFFQSGEWIDVAHPVFLFLFVSMGCVVFGSLGIMTGFLAKSFDQINAFSSFVVLPLIYLGGVFFSLKILHPFWQEVAKFNPIVYMISGIRWSVIEVQDVSLSSCFTILILFMVLSFSAAWWSVRYGSYHRF